MCMKVHAEVSLANASPAAQVEPVTKTDYEEKWDWRVENENKPIWTRNPKVSASAALQ